jgi:hypothetical protein
VETFLAILDREREIDLKSGKGREVKAFRVIMLYR